MKKIFLALAMIALITTAAFGQIVLGVTAVQYYQEDTAISDSWEQFKTGEGVFWGGYAEIILGKLGVGFSFNQQTYKNDLLPNNLLDEWNYDANFFLSYHLFGGRAFIDPFLQAGLGIFAYDLKNKDAYREYLNGINPGDGDWISDDPWFASSYFDFGLGLGLNLSGIGIFAKAMWNVESDEPLYDNTNNPIWNWPVYPFKWTFGAKVIL